jgi:Fe-S-cluster containining protein
MSSDSTPDELFECRMCGDCCRGYGGTYVSADDIQAIADYLRIDPSRFKDQYCRLSGSRYVITQSDNGYCIFWDQLCRIHPVKPRMCRNWPFIEAVLKDVANWRIMGDSCPGIHTDLPDAVIYRTVARLIKERHEARCIPTQCEKVKNG